jgi:hypothetical protein
MDSIGKEEKKNMAGKAQVKEGKRIQVRWPWSLCS